MKKHFYTLTLFYTVAVACFFTLGMFNIHSKEKKPIVLNPKVQPVLEIDKQAVEIKKVKAIPADPGVEPAEKKKLSKKIKKHTPVLEKDKPAISPRDMWLIDKILVRINGVNIFKSVLDEPQIAKDGGIFTLQEAIYHELLFQKAAERQVLPRAVDIERQIVSLKMQRGVDGMSDAAFEKELKESGFTVAMYKRQLGRLIAVENVKRMEVDDKIIITSQDVEAFHKKNPEYDKESYHLRIATIPNDKKDVHQELIEDGKLTWSDKGWIAKAELDERYSFVSTMKKGAISKPVNVNNKTLLFHVVDRKDKKLKELTHRYSAIEGFLREQQRSKYIDDFLSELEAKASIVYV